MNLWKVITPPSQFCVSPNIGLHSGSNLSRNIWVAIKGSELESDAKKDFIALQDGC